MRRLFEEHGEIKTFFDLIGNRGMVFVTYVGSGSSPATMIVTEKLLVRPPCGREGARPFARL